MTRRNGLAALLLGALALLGARPGLAQSGGREDDGGAGSQGSAFNLSNRLGADLATRGVDYAKIAQETEGNPQFGRYLFFKSGAGPIQRIQVRDPKTGRMREETDEEYYLRAAPQADQRAWEFFGVPDPNGYADPYNPGGPKRSGGMSFLPKSYGADKDPRYQEMARRAQESQAADAGRREGESASGGDRRQPAGSEPSRAAGRIPEPGSGETTPASDEGAGEFSGGQSEKFEGQEVQNLGLPPEAMAEIANSYSAGPGVSPGPGGASAGDGASYGSGPASPGRSVYETAGAYESARTGSDGGTSFLSTLRALLGLKRELDSGRDGDRVYHNSGSNAAEVDSEPVAPKGSRVSKRGGN